MTPRSRGAPTVAMLLLLDTTADAENKREVRYLARGLNTRTAFCTIGVSEALSPCSCSTLKPVRARGTRGARDAPTLSASSGEDSSDMAMCLPAMVELRMVRDSTRSGAAAATLLPIMPVGTAIGIRKLVVEAPARSEGQHFTDLMCALEFFCRKRSMCTWAGFVVL